MDEVYMRLYFGQCIAEMYKSPSFPSAINFYIKRPLPPTLHASLSLHFPHSENLLH
jgi:hypothetical protein